MAAPSISVIIATCNRRAVLEQVLRAYDAQEGLERDFEVIVVDDGSTDGTAELLSSWQPSRYAWKHAAQGRSGPGRARNVALRQAEGEAVLFTGDDILPAPTLLARHLEAHRRSRTPFAAFVGFSGWPAGMKLTSTMRHVTGVGAQQFSYHYFKDRAEYDFRHLYTSNFSIRRTVLDLEPTYFSTAFPKAAFEDVELSYRLSFHGMRIYYLAGARAEHHHHFDVGRFFGRQVACGEMGAILVAKYPELRKWVRTAELERVRILGLRETQRERRRTLDAAGQLAGLEERLVRVAGFFDDLHIKALDALLVAIFDYAYLKGLASALYGVSRSPSICGYLFKTRVVPALEAFKHGSEAVGLPVPAADFRALCRHAS